VAFPPQFPPGHEVSWIEKGAWPTTREGRSEALAISVIDSDEVLLEKIKGLGSNALPVREGFPV